MRQNLGVKELWSQQKVARHFNVSGNTIKNWRERGLLSYFKAPGSNRPLYYRCEVESFQETFTKWRKEAGKRQKRVNRAKPGLSSNDDWRIS
jgi:hypothetical protein